MARLIPGILALFGCIALAQLNVSAYVGHLDSGDQAGFSLGTFFLVGWFLPIAATLLLIGTVLVAPAGTRLANRLLRIIAVGTLIAGAVFFVAHVRWMRSTFWHARQTASDVRLAGSHVLAILSFSATLLACALAIRRDPSSPRRRGARWVSGLMVILAMIVSYQIAAQVAGLMSEGMLLVHLPFVAGPTLVWAAVLLWSAWKLSREGAVAKSEGTRTQGV